MNPKGAVQGPAIGMMIAGGLGMLFNLFFMAVMVLGAGLGAFAKNMPQQMGNLAQGVMGVVIYGLFAIMALIMVVGGLKMRNLRSYPLAMAGTIIAILPCYHSCCILGMPFGIWGLVMLLKPEVKAAFDHVAKGGDPDQLPEDSAQGGSEGPPPSA